MADDPFGMFVVDAVLAKLIYRIIFGFVLILTSTIHHVGIDPRRQILSLEQLGALAKDDDVGHNLRTGICDERGIR